MAETKDSGTFRGLPIIFEVRGQDIIPRVPRPGLEIGDPLYTLSELCEYLGYRRENLCEQWRAFYGVDENDHYSGEA